MPISPSNLTFTHNNVNGLSSLRDKRRDVFKFLKTYHPSEIYSLCDTRFQKHQMQYVKMEWGSDIRYSNNGAQSSRGIMVGFGRRFDKEKIGRTVSFDNGNILLQEIFHNNTKILLVVLYGPNEDSPTFFDSVGVAIRKFMDESQVDFLIITGDYNLTLNPSEDTTGYRNVNNPMATERLKLLIKEFDLHDIWRVFNPGVRRFTYRQKNPTSQIADGYPEYKQS